MENFWTDLKDNHFQKNFLRLNGAWPGLLLIFDFFTGRLGANPPEAIIRTTGVVSIIFLALTLLVTPLSKLKGQQWIVKHRRGLGLWCFYYASIHLLSYSLFDKGLQWADISQDITKRPFILLGFLGFLILIPLALTSNNEVIKKMGAKKWKKLHLSTYLVPPLVVTHYWLIVKSDIFYPAFFALAFTLLLTYRAWVQGSILLFGLQTSQKRTDQKVP